MKRKLFTKWQPEQQLTACPAGRTAQWRALAKRLAVIGRIKLPDGGRACPRKQNIGTKVGAIH